MLLCFPGGLREDSSFTSGERIMMMNSIKVLMSLDFFIRNCITSVFRFHSDVSSGSRHRLFVFMFLLVEYPLAASSSSLIHKCLFKLIKITFFHTGYGCNLHSSTLLMSLQR